MSTVLKETDRQVSEPPIGESNRRMDNELPVLESARASRDRSLDLALGARAVVSEDEALQVFAPDGQLVFEYDPATGRNRVVAPAGCLEIVTGSDLSLRSGNEISIEARRVVLRGREELSLETGRKTTAFRIKPGSLDIASESLHLAAGRAAFECGETVFRGNRIEGTFERASLVIGRLETVARTVVEKARNVYRTVEKLAQLKAGRVRTVVDGSHVVRARKTTVHADEDVRIQANKIHLG
jgi:hypothetical protein